MSLLINGTNLAEVIKALLDEWERSNKIHGPFPKMTERQTLIVLEEFLEAGAELTKVALNMARWDKVSLGGMTQAEMKNRIYDIRFERLNALRKELVHSGAMVIKYLLMVHADLQALHDEASKEDK